MLMKRVSFKMYSTQTRMLFYPGDGKQLLYRFITSPKIHAVKSQSSSPVAESEDSEITRL
jgi:hypothetical protein